MARREKKMAESPKAMWLVTFSDLVTLLLTFFVLLLSMASMDRSFFTRMNVFTADIGPMTYKGAGQVPSRLRIVVELFERPLDVLLKQDRIKDLLFPDDVLPPEIDRSTLAENLKILATPEGVALVLTDELLFARGEFALTPAARAVLGEVSKLLNFMNAPVNIAGHTDTEPGETRSNYTLSALRALAVLDFFLEQGHYEERFSASGYGPDQPIADNDTEQGRAQNRRVEILLKTTPVHGVYP